jgi:hypothetical protein
MDVETRERLIARYKDGCRAVAEALQGVTEDELDARPAPNKWSAREIVHHLADSEMMSAIRLKLLLAEEHPTIQNYDQEEFARRLYYDRPIALSAEVFHLARRATSEILDRMTDAEWAREGTHSAHGRYTMEHWLRVYGDHAFHHADQILRARAAARRSSGQGQ